MAKKIGYTIKIMVTGKHKERKDMGITPLIITGFFYDYTKSEAESEALAGVKASVERINDLSEYEMKYKVINTKQVRLDYVKAKNRNNEEIAKNSK